VIVPWGYDDNLQNQFPCTHVGLKTTPGQRRGRHLALGLSRSPTPWATSPRSSTRSAPCSSGRDSTTITGRRTRCPGLGRRTRSSDGGHRKVVGVDPHPGSPLETASLTSPGSCACTHVAKRAVRCVLAKYNCHGIAQDGVPIVAEKKTTNFQLVSVG
jgi:hypothetical protein